MGPGENSPDAVPEKSEPTEVMRSPPVQVPVRLSMIQACPEDENMGEVPHGVIAIGPPPPQVSSHSNASALINSQVGPMMISQAGHMGAFQGGSRISAVLIRQILPRGTHGLEDPR